MSKITRPSGWGISEKYKFTRFRPVGSTIECALASIFINYIDNMLLSVGQNHFYPQFLVKFEQKYFPSKYQRISKVIQIIKRAEPNQQENFALELKNQPDLVNEFILLGADFTSQPNFSIESFCSLFSYELNVQIKVYNSEDPIFYSNENRYTEALVLSIVYCDNPQQYGVIYNENFKVFSPENFNLDYTFKALRPEPSPTQLFDNFLCESLEILSRATLNDSELNTLKLFYYQLKKLSQKHWDFEDKLKMISEIPKCSFCLTIDSVSYLNCGCYFCYECINSINLGTTCPNCEKPMNKQDQDTFKHLKSMIS